MEIFDQKSENFRSNVWSKCKKNRIRPSVRSSKNSKNIIFKELEIINFQLKLVNVDNKLAKKICRNLSRNHQITNSKMFFL